MSRRMLMMVLASVIVLGLAPGWASAQTTYLPPVHDDFEDGVLSGFWTPLLHTVTEANGYCRISTDVTDQGGLLYSDWMTVAVTDTVVFSWRNRLHHVNPYFIAVTRVEIEGMPGASVGFRHSDYIYGDDIMGTQLMRRTASFLALMGSEDVSAAIPSTWDTWYLEEFLYVPATGAMAYHVDGVERLTFTTDPITDRETINVRTFMDPWGWWTGHYQDIDDYSVTTRPGPPVSGEISIIGRYDTGDDPTNWSRDVAVVGDLCFIADNENGLVVVDVSDPTNPAPTDSLDTGGNVCGVHVAGDIAYVTNGYPSAGKLTLVDVSDPWNLSVISSVATSGNAQHVDVGGGGYVFVACLGGGMDVIDAGDPALPTVIGNVPVEDPNAVYRVETWPHHYYVYVSVHGVGLRIYDVNSPWSPTLVSEVNVPEPGHLLKVGGGYYACLLSGPDLTFIDIQDRENPFIAGQCHGEIQGGTDVRIVGDRAFVTDNVQEGLVVLDISDISTPRAIDFAPSVSGARALEVVDDLAYIADHTAGLTIMALGDHALEGGLPVRGVVFEDVDGDGVFDRATEPGIYGASLILDDSIETVTDRRGEFTLQASQAGPGHRVVAGAAGFASAFLDNVTAPTTFAAPLEIGLVPYSPANLELWEINPSPASPELTVAEGGTVHRYYQLVDAATGQPVGGVEIGYSAGQKAVYTCESQPDGLADICVLQADLGVVGSTPALVVESINGEPLAEPLETVCNIEPRPAETSFISNGGGSGSIAFKVGGGIRTIVTLINDGEDAEVDRIRIEVGRMAELGVSTGTSIGFSGEVSGPVHAKAEAEVGGTVSGRGYVDVVSCHEFAWPPSEDEARQIYLLLANAKPAILDGPLSKVLINCALAGSQDWDGYQWDQAENGAEAAVDLVTALGADTDEGVLGFHVHSSVEASGKGYAGVRSHDDGAITRYAGIRLIADVEHVQGVGIPQPSVGSTAPGSAALKTSFTMGGSLGAGFGVECYVESPDWHSAPSEIGFRSTLLADVGGERNNHMRVYVRDGGLIQALIDAGVEVISQLYGFKSETSTIKLYDSAVINSLLKGHATVVNIQDLYENGILPAGEGMTLGYEIENETVEGADSPNWSLDLSVDLGPVGASFSSYALREIAHRAVTRRGEWRQGRDYVGETYPETVQRATSLTYQEVLGTIVDRLPFWTKLGIRTRFLEGIDKSRAVTSITLLDEVSRLDVDPLHLPAGAKESYWTWSGTDSTGIKTIRPDAARVVRDIRKRAEASYGMTYGIGGFHQFEPEGAAFAGPATLTLAYADSEVVGIDENQLAVYYEDKINHRYVHVGGVVDPDSNRVVVPITELRMYTLAPRLPYGTIELAANPASLPADGAATTSIVSAPLLNNDGTPVPDGSLYTVTTTGGTILDGDADPATEGRQVPTGGGVLTLTLQAPEIAFPAIVKVWSMEGAAAGADTVSFTDTSTPVAPTGLRVAGQGMNSLSIAWDRNPEPDIAGYRIYFDADSPLPPYDGLVAYGALPSPFDVAADTTVTIMGLDLATPYWVTVTAYDIEGNESPFPATVQSASTTEAGGSDVPRATSLHQNFPNPFNPTTRIEYALPRTERVSLKIYDVQGRLVRTLVDEVVPQGRHEAVWRAEDDAGKRVASGVYIYLLKAGGESRSRKMAVVR